MFLVQRNIKPMVWICAGNPKTLYDAKEKKSLRRWLAHKVKLLGSYFELTGLGESYKEIRKIAPNAKITTIDNGKNISPKIIDWLKKNKDFLFTTVKKFAKRGKETFAVIFADYCGTIGKTTNHGILEDLTHMHKIMQGKTVFAITTMCQREYLFEKGAPRQKIDQKTEDLIIKALTKNCNMKFKKLKDFKYSSIPHNPNRKTMRPTKMRVIIWEITKI